MQKNVKEAPKPRWKIREKAVFIFGGMVGVALWWLVSSIYSYAEYNVAKSCEKYDAVQIAGKMFECREIGG